VNLSPDTVLAIQRYSDLAVDLEGRGGLTKADWEHARSYAVEALSGLLRDNPDRFDYARRMEAASKAKLNTPK
jgi:hypothetical protein